jgi:hypothetical protein
LTFRVKPPVTLNLAIVGVIETHLYYGTGAVHGFDEKCGSTAWGIGIVSII